MCEHSFGTQGSTDGFDLRKGSLAYLWTQAIKNNDTLKQQYGAVGRNYKAQSEFRKKWALMHYELELNRVTITDINDEWEGCVYALFAWGLTQIENCSDSKFNTVLSTTFGSPFVFQ